MDEDEKIIKRLQEVRRTNLVRLIGDEHVSDFAKRYNLNPTYMSQLKGRKRPFGEKAARKVEHHIGLPWFSLDQDPADVLDNASEDEILNAVSGALGWLSDDAKKRLVREISQAL